MKTVIIFRHLLLGSLLMAGFTAMAQTENKTSNSTEMKTYLIEREIPGAGNFTEAELKGISQKSCGVLDGQGPQIKWIHSYVVDNHIYCVYQAANEDLIREHGARGGFPVTNIMEIKNTISPATAK